jgi:hypothetical protein
MCCNMEECVVVDLAYMPRLWVLTLDLRFLYNPIYIRLLCIFKNVIIMIGCIEVISSALIVN